MTISGNWNGPAGPAREIIMQGVVTATEMLRTEMVRMILNTPKTGALYFRKSGKGRSRVSKSGRSFSGGHRASAPGEAPASDTGRLINSIDTYYDQSILQGTVNVGVEYGLFLEYGTRKMEPRPFARPTVVNKRGEVREIILAAVRTAVGL